MAYTGPKRKTGMRKHQTKGEIGTGRRRRFQGSARQLARSSHLRTEGPGEGHTRANPGTAKKKTPTGTTNRAARTRGEREPQARAQGVKKGGKTTQTMNTEVFDLAS